MFCPWQLGPKGAVQVSLMPKLAGAGFIPLKLTTNCGSGILLTMLMPLRSAVPSAFSEVVGRPATGFPWLSSMDTEPDAYVLRGGLVICKDV